MVKNTNCCNDNDDDVDKQINIQEDEEMAELININNYP